MKVAYLGPAGTHSELACREFLPDAEGAACFSLAEIFRLVLDGGVDAGMVPIENMIQGPVTETLDQLFEHHGKVFISDSYLMQIRNALGVLSPGAEVRSVYSHEQPLRQCSKYLSEKLPRAEQIAAPSTAAAIRTVKEGRMKEAAVIAAEGTLRREGFTVLQADISDVSTNKTRFVLIRRGSVEEHLPARETYFRGDKQGEPLGFVTSLVVDPGRDRKALLFEILQVISIKHRVNIVTIHSRPDTRGGVVFYFDLEGHPTETNIRNCLFDLRQFCADTTGKSTEIHVLGAYPRAAFYTLPFRTVGIVGSAGVMGQWFCRFFRDAGLEVLECDQQKGLSLREIAERSEVVILSVPMSSAEKIAQELVPLLRDGQLVVENCSIKSCVLPSLVENAPQKVEILGIHTMFAGDVPSLADQNIIVTKTWRSAEKAQAFEDLLYKHGARIRHSSIESHDHSASFVQSVLQLSMLVLADVMERSFSSVDNLDFISTPNFRNILNVITRVVNQSDDLLLDLQIKNEQAINMRHKYLESAFRLVSALDQGNRKEFLETAAKLREYFGR